MLYLVTEIFWDVTGIANMNCVKSEENIGQDFYLSDIRPS